MAKIVSFINYKGGVGKTTTTYHVGCSLADHHGKMTQNALVASDSYVVTTIPEFLSRIGIEILDKTVRSIQGQVGEAARNAGFTGVDVAEMGGIVSVKVRIGGTRITDQHEGWMTTLQGAFPGKCFDDYTTELIDYSEAAQLRLPIWLANTPNARRAARKSEYENVTNEFLRRFP